MQFNRSALVEAIDRAIAQEQAVINATRAKNEEASKSHREEWMSLHHDNWQKAATAIRAKLRRGDPVTEDDIPRDRTGYHGGKAFYRAHRGEPLPTTRTELSGLRAVLDAISDDAVSSNSLRSLGVSVNTLRLVVPLLGAATVRSENLKAHTDKMKAGKA